MVLNEFLTDIKIVSELFSATNMVDHVREFANIATNAKSGTEANWREMLLKKLDELDELVLNFEATQSAILVENTYLKASEFGELVTNFRQHIEEIFEDIIAADSKITALAEQLQTFKTHSDQIRAAFQTVGVKIPESDEVIDQNLATFEFKYESDVNNLKELGSTSRLLNVHLRSLCKLDLSTQTTDIEIAVVSKSSPLAIKAWLSKKTAEALNKIISEALENFKKIQEIRSMVEAIKQQKLDTRGKKLELALQTRRAELETQVIDSITKHLMRRFPDDSQNGTRNEVEIGVNKAVDYFITQTSKGLEVRVLPSKDDLTNDEQGKSIIQSYQHKLEEAEQILKQLPERTDFTESDEDSQEQTEV